jgi:hypothetical protein
MILQSCAATKREKALHQRKLSGLAERGTNPIQFENRILQLVGWHGICSIRSDHGFINCEASPAHIAWPAGHAKQNAR